MRSPVLFLSSPSPSSSSSVSFLGTSLCTFHLYLSFVSRFPSHFFHYAFLHCLPGMPLSQRRPSCSIRRQCPEQPPRQTCLREQRFRSFLLGRLRLVNQLLRGSSRHRSHERVLLRGTEHHCCSRWSRESRALCQWHCTRSNNHC